MLSTADKLFGGLSELQGHSLFFQNWNSFQMSSRVCSFFEGLPEMMSFDSSLTVFEVLLEFEELLDIFLSEVSEAEKVLRFFGPIRPFRHFSRTFEEFEEP